MILRSALAGPGPKTLAYRLARQIEVVCLNAGHVIANPAVQFPPKCFGPVVPFSTTCVALEDKRRKGNKSKTKTITKLTGPNRAPTAAGHATKPLKDVLDYVPLLAAPPKYRKFTPHLERLRRGMEKKDLDRVVESYSRLSDWLSTDQLTLSDWEQISELLAGEMSLPLAPTVLSRKYHQNPESMGWLSTLAIEAAVRDYWTGLYQLFLSLITAGHPQLIVNAYERYRDGLHVYQGKNKEDLYSWNRTRRMAARTTGEGIKPISTVHLAALTMLEKIQPANLTRIFGTDSNWIFIDHSTRRDVIRAFGKGHDAKVLNKKFDEAVDKFLFAILCYHPATMEDRLVSLRNSNSREQFFTLYQRILDWSIGPDRILRPMDLDTKGGLEGVKDIVIPPALWRKSFGN